MKKKVGFFGGSFDPIHVGHLSLAISLLEAYHLDEVIFSPAHVSPLKTQMPPLASAVHRREMVKRAIAPVSKFSLWDQEVLHEGVSFTIDAVRAISKSRGEGTQLYLLLAEDLLEKFGQWKEVEELIRLAPPLVGSRTAGHTTSFQTIKTPIMEISSTQIRERLKKGLYSGHLLPACVLEYIISEGLYR